MIHVPFFVTDRPCTVVHGVSGISKLKLIAQYVRGNAMTTVDDMDIWKSLGYLWTDVVKPDDLVPVLRVCRDLMTRPDYTHVAAAAYGEIGVQDGTVKNGVPRWDDDYFRQATITPGCSASRLESCRTKDIIKLAQQGQVVVDGEFNCFIEPAGPENHHLPVFTFDRPQSVAEVLDATARSTLISGQLGSEIAIVMVLGRIHLIRRDPTNSGWYPVNRVGIGGDKSSTVAFALEMVLGDTARPLLRFESFMDRQVNLPSYWLGLGTQHLKGYIGEC
ncbi:hypothetical protein K3495_g1933 [Podosphaera aphanis]|nr:hypothetical protein K3495_g1933 [Podosphaera aphanis]